MRRGRTLGEEEQMCMSAFLAHIRTRSKVVFFFFQAEDGIRDGRVTGVQTCALPISRRLYPVDIAMRPRRVLQRVGLVYRDLDGAAGDGRSEERRVGKECRSRWS